MYTLVFEQVLYAQQDRWSYCMLHHMAACDVVLLQPESAQNQARVFRMLMSFC